jgi:hypothetical protein
MDKFFFKLQEKQNKNQLFKTSKNSNKAWWIGVAATPEFIGYYWMVY